MSLRKKGVRLTDMREFWLVVCLFIGLMCSLLQLGGADKPSVALEAGSGGDKIFLKERSQAGYAVRANDSLSHIAMWYRSSTRAIEEANPALAANSRNMQIGSRVVIPLKESRP